MLSFAVYVTVIGYQNQASADREIAAWEKRHPDRTPDPWERFLGADDPDARPIEFEASLVPLFVGLGAALVAALVGRGVRYVLANE